MVAKFQQSGTCYTPECCSNAAKCITYRLSINAYFQPKSWCADQSWLQPVWRLQIQL